MPRFAANLTWLFAEYDFLDRFDAAAECGFEAVEVLFPYDHPAEAIADRLARNKLTMALINAPPGSVSGGERGLAALPDRADAFRDSLALAANYAHATGARRVHVMAGLADAGDNRAAATYRDNIAHAADYFAPRGIKVMIEPINSRDDPAHVFPGCSDRDAAATESGAEPVTALRGPGNLVGPLPVLDAAGGAERPNPEPGDHPGVNGSAEVLPRRADPHPVVADRHDTSEPITSLSGTRGAGQTLA